jgi:hypothetical protein
MAGTRLLAELAGATDGYGEAAITRTW